MVAKPDKRAGSASKAVGTERCGVQVLWLSPSPREFGEYRMQRVGAMLGWVKFPRRTCKRTSVWTEARLESDACSDGHEVRLLSLTHILYMGVDAYEKSCREAS